MTKSELENRIAMIEEKLSRMQNRLDELPGKIPTNKDWIKDIWGSFSGDPLFEEAMSFGRKWRAAENRKAPPGVKKKLQKRRK